MAVSVEIAGRDGTFIERFHDLAGIPRRNEGTIIGFPDDATFWYLSPFLNDPQKRWIVDPYMHCLVDNPFLKEFQERLALARIALEVMPKQFSVVSGRKRLPNGEWQDYEESVVLADIRSTIDGVLRLAEKAEREGKALLFLGD